MHLSSSRPLSVRTERSQVRCGNTIFITLHLNSQCVQLERNDLRSVATLQGCQRVLEGFRATCVSHLADMFCKANTLVIFLFYENWALKPYFLAIWSFFQDTNTKCVFSNILAIHGKLIASPDPSFALVFMIIQM